jgi:hypothetical protein
MLAQRTLAVRCVCGGARSQSAPTVAASGGSLDGAGPVVANGMVFVNSGYPPLRRNTWARYMSQSYEWSTHQPIAI